MSLDFKLIQIVAAPKNLNINIKYSANISYQYLLSQGWQDWLFHPECFLPHTCRNPHHFDAHPLENVYIKQVLEATLNIEPKKIFHTRRWK